MRAAIVLGGFPVISETFILRQITGLLDQGWDVDIYAEGRPPGERQHPAVAAYRLLARTTYLTLPRRCTRFGEAVPWLASCLYQAPRVTGEVLAASRWTDGGLKLSTLYHLYKLSSPRPAYDVIHAHYGPVASRLLYLRSLWRAPMIVSFHGYDFSVWPRRHGPAVYHSLFRGADCVTINSDYGRQRLETLGCPAGKIRRLNYAVDLGAFAFRARTLAPGAPVRLLTVARLVEKKGLEYSIRAAAAVLQHHPNLRYDIVGDGPLQPRLAELIRQLDLSHAVTLHGAQDNATVRQMMDDAHLFVLASVTAVDGDQEGTPVALIEAQASGLPVVSTRHSGIPETVRDGRSGYLAPERDVAGLAQHLTALIEHPETWPRLGRAGRRHAEEHFDLHGLSQQLTELYREVIDQRAHAAVSMPAITAEPTSV